MPASFHSTDCPSEWGPYAPAYGFEPANQVSIQLIAPASGALLPLGETLADLLDASFHSTDCPSEWGREEEN